VSPFGFSDLDFFITRLGGCRTWRFNISKGCTWSPSRKLSRFSISS